MGYLLDHSRACALMIARPPMSDMRTNERRRERLLMYYLDPGSDWR